MRPNRRGKWGSGCGKSRVWSLGLLFGQTVMLYRTVQDLDYVQVTSPSKGGLGLSLFFGVFPSHVGQLSCVLCAYLWRPSVINLLYLHVSDACRSSLSPLPTILLSSRQFITSPLCLTLNLLPHRPNFNQFSTMH